MRCAGTTPACASCSARLRSGVSTRSQPPKTSRSIGTRPAARSSGISVTQPSGSAKPALMAAVNKILGEYDKSNGLQKSFDKWLGADSPYKFTRDYKVEPIKTQ